MATTPGSESIDGTVFGPRLLGPDRAVGVAYARAVIRTINTHLADGYGDDALPVVAEAIGEDEDVVADGPAPLFDWEIRQGTMARIQDALETDVSDATVVTLYMLSAINVKLRPILTRDLRRGARIVSHSFAMGDWEPAVVDTFRDAQGTSRTLYLWTADGRVRP